MGRRHPGEQQRALPDRHRGRHRRHRPGAGAVPLISERPPGGSRLIRVDCHLHTVYSGDAVTTIDQLAERVAETGLDVVCVTDHHSVQGAAEALARDIGARVIVGEEIRTTAGELIGLFLAERIPYVLPVDEVVTRIRAQGALVYAPHPFDPVRSSLGDAMLGRLAERGDLDIVEVFNAKVSDPEHNRLAAEAARRYGLPAGAGSDAHDPVGVGAAYLEMPDFDGPADFLAKLGEARVVGELRDHAPLGLIGPPRRG
ncbi:MAG: PHP domain-containing protein [Streptosporangiales bacterium]|nr:PHP domain-containing protein [Streptosporangiales bacterium]